MQCKSKEDLEEEIRLLKDIDNIKVCSLNELLSKYESAKEKVELIEAEILIRKGIGI